MLKNYLRAVLALACVLCGSASCAATGPVIDFTELPAQPVNGVHIKGVTFGFTINGMPSTDATFGGAAPGGMTYITPPALEGNANGVLTITFDVPVSTYSFGIARSTNQPITGASVTSVGGDGTARVTAVLLSPGAAFSEGSYTYTGPAVTSVSITFPNPAQAPRFLIDNITYTVGGGGTPPGAPTLSGTTAGGQDFLSWAAVTGATGYNLKRSTVSGGPYTTIATTTGTTFTDIAVVSGTTYYYVVTATNTAGESGNSNQVALTPVNTVMPPAVPINLVAVGGNAQIALTWNAAANATGYNVKRSLVMGGPYTTIAGTVNPNYTDLNVINGTRYFYVVTATNAGGESGNSNEANAVPQIPAPAAPLNLVAVAGNAQITLTWNAVAGAASYNVKRSLVMGGGVGGYTQIANVAPATYLDMPLVNGTRYYYVVTAVNAGGQSPNSNEANAVPFLPIPAAPNGLTVVPGYTNGADGYAQITLTWNASANATSYVIKRRRQGEANFRQVANGVRPVTYVDKYKGLGFSIYPGVAATYVVDAVNAAGTSADSVPATTTAVEYINQKSATTRRHSGICTIDGRVVWDDQFQTLVNNALMPGGVQKYDKTIFAFMECFGGGMIDELLPLPGDNVYTSAARGTQTSLARDPRGIARNVFGPVESTYNRNFAPAANGGAMRDSAIAGLFGDTNGPNMFLAPRTEYVCTGQYISNGAAVNGITTADGVKLHQGSAKYLAVLFGGSSLVDAGLLINPQTINRMYATLLAVGYKPAEIFICYPGGPNGVDPIDANTNVAGMKAAWTWVKNNTTPTTQVFYWSSWGHGTVAVRGKSKGLKFRMGGAAFTLAADDDLKTSMTTDLNFWNHVANAPALNFALVVHSLTPITSPQVILNGHTLPFLQSIDIFGDGSEYDTYFAVNSADINGLTANTNVQVNWDGIDPQVDYVAASAGEAPGDYTLAPSISGTVTLDSVSNGSLPVAFTLRPSSGSPYTITTTPEPDGTFTLLGINPDTYTLHAKADRWLAKNVSVNTTSDSVSGIALFLPGGDADNNNVVDIADFGLLINAYGGDSTVPGSNYDIHADFNNDAIVDIADFSILVNNYGSSGDM